MKRRDLLRHLSQHGCSLLREGGRHSWWHNQVSTGEAPFRATKEINDQLARKICKDLGVPSP